MSRREKEPPAPTPLDEAMSLASLTSSPWVVARIKELGLEGKKVNHWTPPQYSVPVVSRLSSPQRL
jgi:hypothetical protein